jgi:hypothetical protein
MKKENTKKAYKEWLNDIDPPEEDLKSNGGRISDGVPYGTWIQKNDPIAFEVGYREWLLDRTYKDRG